jgi:hypothetical protein
LGQSPKLNEETGFDEFVSDDGERIYADLVIADEYSTALGKLRSKKNKPRENRVVLK